ncbi:MAG: transposase [Terrimicrobiaceae bacterium]
MILDARYKKSPTGRPTPGLRRPHRLRDASDGKHSFLGVSVALNEDEVHWCTFQHSLQSRGLHGLSFIVSDAHAGFSTGTPEKIAQSKTSRTAPFLREILK